MLKRPCRTCQRLMRPHRRGCCSYCYETHRGRIALGNTTWAVLEAQGLVLPASRVGPDGGRRRR